MSLVPSIDVAATDREALDVATVAMVAVLAASIGYEAGSVLAGDSPELFWLVPVFGGTFVVAFLAAQEDD